MLVDGSPLDSCRRPRIDLRRMACKRSGVRIPLAPPQVVRVNSNTEPVSSWAFEGQIEGQFWSVTRVLTCGDICAGSCGPQVVALLEARRSGISR